MSTHAFTESEERQELRKQVAKLAATYGRDYFVEKARSGGSVHPMFEGGQMPHARRVPKRGFHSPFRKEFQIVNLETLDQLVEKGRIQNGVINPEVHGKLGVVKSGRIPVKILGTGDLKAKLDITAHAFSKSATEKITKAGGKTQTISSAPKE